MVSLLSVLKLGVDVLPLRAALTKTLALAKAEQREWAARDLSSGSLEEGFALSDATLNVYPAWPRTPDLPRRELCRSRGELAEEKTKGWSIALKSRSNLFKKNSKYIYKKY